MDFVAAIHAYFSYPQRKAKPKKIQSENNYPVKLLLNYGGTRWLSLGQCLRRLLETRGSLVMYMNQPNKKTSSKKETKKIKYFKSQLSCEILYLKILFLEYILNKINGFNEQLQDQTMNISKMKSKLKSCFNSVLEIICKPIKFEKPFTDLVLKDWESKEVQEEYFMQGKDFVQAISELINPKFDGLFNQSEIIQEDTIRILQEFLAKLLNLFQVSINFSDNVLEASDFLELDHPYHILKSKLLTFNNIFTVFDSENFKSVYDELLTLRDEGMNKYRDNLSKSSLTLWNNIPVYQTQSYPFLVKIASIALTLPTSSSDVEQCFSIMKLFKTNKRNSLNEMK